MELPLEDAHLVAEHHDLELRDRLGPPPGDDEAEEPAEAEVERERATAMMPEVAGKCQFRDPIVFLAPAAPAEERLRGPSEKERVIPETIWRSVTTIGRLRILGAFALRLALLSYRNAVPTDLG